MHLRLGRGIFSENSIAHSCSQPTLQISWSILNLIQHSPCAKLAERSCARWSFLRICLDLAADALVKAATIVLKLMWMLVTVTHRRERILVLLKLRGHTGQGLTVTAKCVYLKHAMYRQAGTCWANQTLRPSNLQLGALTLELVQECFTTWYDKC
jgi:hypothetical protein